MKSSENNSSACQIQSQSLISSVSFRKPENGFPVLFAHVCLMLTFQISEKMWKMYYLLASIQHFSLVIHVKSKEWQCAA